MDYWLFYHTAQGQPTVYRKSTGLYLLRSETFVCFYRKYSFDTLIHDFLLKPCECQIFAQLFFNIISSTFPCLIAHEDKITDISQLVHNNYTDIADYKGIISIYKEKDAKTVSHNSFCSRVSDCD